MSDGSLTQEEIDALLQGSVNFSTPEGGPAPSLSPEELQKFRALLQNTVASQAANLSMLTGKQVEVRPPEVKAVQSETFIRGLPEQVVKVDIPFTEGTRAAHGYVLDREVSTLIAGLLMGQENVELTEAAVSALQEGLSQMNGPVVTSLGDVSGMTILTAPAQGAEFSRDQLNLDVPEVVTAEYPVVIDGVGHKVIEFFDVPFVRSLVNPSRSSPSRPANQAFTSAQGATMAQSQGQPTVWGPGAPQVQQVQFPSFPEGALGPEQQANISLLMDVYMELTVELGRTKKMVKEILAMGEGTIIELDKLAGEPVDILVNHKLIARGEVVVIDENFGVRVTEIISPLERLNELT